MGVYVLATLFDSRYMTSGKFASYGCNLGGQRDAEANENLSAVGNNNVCFRTASTRCAAIA